MRTNTTIALPFLVAWFFAGTLVSAQPHDDKERAELAKALKEAKISLQQGVTASVKEGKPNLGEVRGRRGQAAPLGLHDER